MAGDSVINFLHGIGKAIDTAFPAVKAITDMGRVVRETLPTNARTYVDTISGNRKKITEKNFTPAEIETLKRNVQESEKDKQEKIKNQKTLIAAMKSNPDAWADIVSTEGGQFKRKNVKEQLAEQEQRLKDYESRPNIVGYEKDDSGELIDFRGWLDSVISSLTSPQYQLNTTLGTATYEQTPEGNVRVKDSYDFNRNGPGARFVKSLRSGETGQLRDIKYPTQILDAIGFLLAPETDSNPRQVEINLGKIPLESARNRK